MASVKETKFLPPLNKCLTGEAQVWSWEDIYSIVTSSSDFLTNRRLSEILNDPKVRRYLSDPLALSRSPNAEDKDLLLAFTSPTPGFPQKTDRYDVDQLKNDALWLSDKCKIDELSALKLTVLDLIRQPQSRLLTRFSEEELLAIQDVVGSTSSALWPLLGTTGLDGDNNDDDRAEERSETKRRHDLLFLYTIETASFTKLLFHVNLLGLYRGANASCLNVIIGHDIPSTLGIFDERSDNFDINRPEGFDQEMQSNFLVRCTVKIRTCLSNYGSDDIWAEDIDDSQTLDEAWRYVQLNHAVYLVRHFLVTILFSGNITAIPAVTAWFDIMEKFGFFNSRMISSTVPAILEISPQLEILASIVSFVILHSNEVRSLVVERPNVPTDFRPAKPEWECPYIFNQDCVNAINETLVNAAKSEYMSASFAMFAWSLIGVTIRDVAEAQNEAYSHRLTSGEQNVSPPDNKWYDIAGIITQKDDVFEMVDGDQISILAMIALRDFHVLELISQVATKATPIFPHAFSAPVSTFVRIAFLELLHQALPVVEYSVELIDAIISILNSNRNLWTHLDHPSTRTDEVAMIFHSDTTGFIPRILNQALARFPLEFAPFLAISSALALGIHSSKNDSYPLVHLLSSMTTFTQMLPRDFNGYEIYREHGNGHMMRLIRTIHLFSSRPTWGRMDYEEDGLMELPEDTVGSLITASPPHVTCWEHQYNAFEFLTSCLDTLTSACSYRLIMTPQGVDLQTASDIISSLTRLLTSCIRWSTTKDQAHDVTEAVSVLDMCTSFASRDRHISAIVFDILDQQLELEYIQTGSEASLDLVIKCIQFIYVLTLTAPSKVWTPLRRSCLLDIEGSGSALAAIVTSREMVSGTYELIRSCARLYEVLLQDAVSFSIRRKATPSKVTTRFDSTSHNDPPTPDRTIGEVLFAYTKVLSGVFESFTSWRYQDPWEKLELGTRLMKIFVRVFTYNYSIDGQTPLGKKVISVLGPSADYLVDSLLSESADSLLPKTILSVIVASVPTLAAPVAGPEGEEWQRQIEAALDLSTTLLRVQSYLDRPPSWLEAQLFKLSPVFVRIFASNYRYHAPVSLLFQTMMETTVKSKGEPTSLIGHMGPGTVRDFLELLMQVQTFEHKEDIEQAIWRLLCSAVRSRQRSFALALVTGSTPRASHRPRQGEADKSGSTGKKSVFALALNKLANMDTLSVPLLSIIVRFVSSSMDFWQMAIPEFGRHPTCLSVLYRFLDTVPPLSESGKYTDLALSTEAAQRRSIAATIAEILAMHVHHERQMGRTDALKQVAGSCKFFKDEGSLSPPYNHSLLANLAKNFNTKFAPFEVQQLKRTLFLPTELGVSFYYDLEFASKALEYDVSWKGGKRSRQTGMKAEFERANANLSWVEAQVRLLNGWELLAIELSYGLGTVPGVNDILLHVVNQRLGTSQMAMNQQPVLMEKVALDSLRLSFTLLQQFASKRTCMAELKGLLPTIWNSFASTGVDFETIYSVDHEKLEFYRIMLKMLFLVIQAGAEEPPKHGLSISRPAGTAKGPDYPFELYLEIFDKVVLRGFKSFIDNLHDDTRPSVPSDLILITGTLQALLQIPVVQLSHPQISLQVSSAETTRYAVTLFSWADRLTKDDPIYAELSVLFLLALSTIPLVAESIAVDGILAQLSSCNLIQYFRLPNGIGPFDKPWRMHSLWAHGILPLCLNLLDAVGPSFGADVAEFINQFPGQLARNADTLASVRSSLIKSRTGNLTLGTVCEAHALALISVLLDSYRAGGAALGVVAADIAPLEWDRSGLEDDIKTWLQSPKLRRERIAPVTERDLVLYKVSIGSPNAYAGIPTAAENLLEERVVKELEGTLLCVEQKVSQ